MSHAIRMTEEEFERAASRLGAKPIKEAPRSNRAKYGNRKTQIDGITFDSKREAHRYVELRRMSEAGIIEDLRLQVPFEVIPACGSERPTKYIADFVFNQDGKQVVMDAKGHKTREYVLKRKLLLWRFGIKIVEV